MVGRISSLFMAFFMVMVPVGAMAAASSPVEVATKILEESTSFHWGKDCLVWIVHYPESLVEPWVDADASSRGLTPEQRDEYLRSFRSQLRMGDAEPFLLTVYHFGSKPLTLSPLGDYLTMKTVEGKGIAPVSYEKKLDQPISGIVQGLVFFPKQKEVFSLVFKGLGVYPEQLFTFDRSSGGVVVEVPVEEVKSRVVELPPLETTLSSKGGKVSAPKPQETARPAVKKTAPDPVPVSPDAEPPAWLGPGPNAMTSKVDDEISFDLKADVSVDLASQLEEVVSGDSDPSADADMVVATSRDRVIEKFLGLWAKGETDGMFEMLASSSRTEGKDGFAKRANGSPLRWCLSDGYKLRWIDANKVKVSVAQKLVLIRVLQSEVLEVVQESGRLSVVW